MRPAESPSPARWGETGKSKPLSTVVYRSRAVAPMSPPALQNLTCTSQARNTREALTGLMLYDNGSFFQWLEGPTDGVDRVMSSICRDSRHTDIEVLNNQKVQSRMFAGWSMKLAAEGAAATVGPQHVIEPPREVVEELRVRPDAAPVLLTRLGPMTADNDESGDASGGARLNAKTTALLKQVILKIVLPAVLGADEVTTSGDSAPAGRVRDLAEALISDDQTDAVDLIRQMHAGLGSTARLYTSLLEPAARALGDSWSEDFCSEVDLTIGLCRLQTAIRLLGEDQVRAVPGGLAQPAVLIVPEPGELHRLCAALDGRILGDAGWSPDCAYPENDTNLQDMVSAKWFDVLDVSLSVALRQEHWLPRLAETIAQARRASRNPALIVVVGGRVFREQAAACASVGADVASKTSGTVDRSILRTMTATRTGTLSQTGQYQVLATPS